MTKNRYFLVFYLAIKRKTWATDEINGVITVEQPTFPSAFVMAQGAFLNKSRGWCGI